MRICGSRAIVIVGRWAGFNYPRLGASMRVLLLAAFACLVDLSCAALFHVEANSTCDSAPLYIEGELIASLDCIGGVEHSASALLDKNQSTLWQSAMGVSNVALSFSSVRKPCTLK